MVTRHSMRQPAVTTLVLFLVSASLPAHHSHQAFYDPCKPVTLEGRIESIQWRNPHVLIDVKLDDGRTYHTEWVSLREVMTGDHVGPAQATLPIGTRVVVMGFPLRDAAQIRASFPEYRGDDRAPNLLDVAQMGRADNSWTWRAENPAACRPR